MAVVKTRRDKRRKLRRSWHSIVQIECLSEENTVAGAEHRLLVIGVRDAESRRKSLVPWLFGVGRTITRACGLAGGVGAGEGQPSGKSAGGRSGCRKVKERKVVRLFARRCVIVPPQGEVERQLGRDIPGVVAVERP